MKLRVKVTLRSAGALRITPASSRIGTESFAELHEFAREEFLVGRLVLPAQESRRLAKLLTALLDGGSHDFIRLGGVGLDHFHRLEVRIGQCLRGLRVGLEPGGAQPTVSITMG